MISGISVVEFQWNISPEFLWKRKENQELIHYIHVPTLITTMTRTCSQWGPMANPNAKVLTRQHPQVPPLPLPSIAPDKAAYCVFTQFCERENAIKFISVRTKTQ